MKTIIRPLITVISMLIACTGFDSFLNTDIVVKDAEARLGRPLTPVSVAGVARRTTRRVIRRTAIFVPVLPVGYTTVVVSGATLYKSGNTYYQAEGSQYVVVNVN